MSRHGAAWPRPDPEHRPAPAVARQVDRVLKERGLPGDEGREGEHCFITSGDIQQYQQILRMLVNVQTQGRPAYWNADQPALLEFTSKEQT